MRCGADTALLALRLLCYSDVATPDLGTSTGFMQNKSYRVQGLLLPTSLHQNQN